MQTSFTFSCAAGQFVVVCRAPNCSRNAVVRIHNTSSVHHLPPGVYLLLMYGQHAAACVRASFNVDTFTAGRCGVVFLAANSAELADGLCCSKHRGSVAVRADAKWKPLCIVELR